MGAQSTAKRRRRQIAGGYKHIRPMQQPKYRAPVRPGDKGVKKTNA